MIEQFCKKHDIPSKQQKRFLQFLGDRDIGQMNEQQLGDEWQKFLSKTSPSKYAIAKYIGVSRQSITQWPNYPEDSALLPAYLRERAAKIRDRAVLASDLVRALETAVTHYRTLPPDKIVSSQDLAKRLNRETSFVYNWGLDDMSAGNIAAVCENKVQFNRNRAQKRIDCAVKLQELAREIEL